MSEENEKYPKIVLGTDNVFRVLIDKDTPVYFRTLESFEKFMKKYNPNIELEEIKRHENRRLSQRNEALKILSGKYPW